MEAETPIAVPQGRPKRWTRSLLDSLRGLARGTARAGEAVGRWIAGRPKWRAPRPTVDDLVRVRAGQPDPEPYTPHYLEIVRQFERGRWIEREYWTADYSVALILTERPRWALNRLLHRPPTMRLHRSNLNSPGCSAKLQSSLGEGDALAVRANWSLGDLSRHAVMDRIFEADVFILRMVDCVGPNDSDELDKAITQYEKQLYRAQLELNTAATRRAQYSYTFGAFSGLALLLGVTALVALVVNVFGHSVREHEVAVCFECVLAGGVGAATSASWNATTGALKIDPAAGIGALPRLALQRATIGAAFGLAAYFALRSGFIDIANLRTTYFFGFFSFVAGFSERFLPDLVKRAEGQATERRSSDPVDPPERET